MARASYTCFLTRHTYKSMLTCRLMAGALTNASISSVPPSATSSAIAPATAPSAAASLPPDLSGLADAAAAALGANGSHVLLLSVTTVGGFCVIILVLAAAVFCMLRRRQKKKQAYVVKSKPSQASMDGDGPGQRIDQNPSPLVTTPKGLRQAYTKAAGLHTGGNVNHRSPMALPNTSSLASLALYLVCVACLGRKHNGKCIWHPFLTE